MKVFLMGYMGSGKSTVGRLLADRLKLKFIDFDKLIEEGEGKSIVELFESAGEEKFREMEHSYLKNMLSEDQVVVSLGGGTPCFHNNIGLINSNGTSVYLKMDAQTLADRLSKAKIKRPLLRGLNGTELKFFIETHLEKRMPVYNQAHITVDGQGRTPDELADAISKKVIS